jgi:hypothetical protein
MWWCRRSMSSSRVATHILRLAAGNFLPANTSLYRRPTRTHPRTNTHDHAPNTHGAQIRIAHKYAVRVVCSSVGLTHLPVRDTCQGRRFEACGRTAGMPQPLANPARSCQQTSQSLGKTSAQTTPHTLTHSHAYTFPSPHLDCFV